MHPTEQHVARVILHGRLRKKFGKEFAIGASTPARAIKILCILLDGFRQELQKGQYRVIRGSLKKGVTMSAPALHMLLPPDGVVHLMPVAAGGKNSGGGKILIGVILVAAAIALPELAPAYFGAAVPATATTVAVAGGSIAVASTVAGVSVLGGLALFGGAMILGGLASILAKDLRPQQQLGNSFLLSGALNVATAGGPVPVVYGRMRIGSVVISLGYEAAAYLGSGTSGFINGVFTNDAGRPAVPGSVSANGDTGYSGDLGYLGTGRGSGGKGGGGGYEAPNTLRSNATVRIIDLLSEGPIKGLVNGPQGIFFNDTPLMGDDGVTWNFHGVSWALLHGLPDQDPVPGFSASEQTTQVGVEVLHDNPIIRTIFSTTANAVRVTLEIPALYDTNTSNGDINQTDLQWVIAQRPSKSGVGGFIGDWTDSVQENLISQKCTAPYEISYRIPLAGVDIGANTWDIRVTKITIDSLRASKQNSLVFENYTIITDHQLMYPDSAYIALVFDAKAFGSSIPTRNYLIDGREVNIPANYDPDARTYAGSGPGTTGGTWDTVTFKAAVTSNPAWILYDMLTHDRYGANIASQFLETARADLYTISGYCDGLVPDGFGGSEPRYTANAVIADQADAYTLIQTMVSAFRGMTYWGAGQVMVTADMPKNPVKLVNQANVVGGNFNYQGTSLKTRHNLVRATWRDPGNRYIPTPETYELTGDIANRGEVATDVVAWGCTSRGLAHRVAKWMIYTENNQTEVLEYDAGLYHMDLRPGEIFEQQDPAYFGLNWAGRLRSVSTATVLHLDRLLDANTTGVASSYTLSVVMPDTTLARLTLAPASIGLAPDSSYSILNLAASGVALPLQPQRNAEWILIDNNTDTRLFQTISLAAGTDPGQFSISALEYNPAKFNFVEFNIAFRPQVFSTLPALLVAALTPPSNVSATDYLVGQGTTTIIRLTVSWTPVFSDLRIKEYEIQVTSPTFQENYRAPLNTIDIDSLVPATYSIAVRSIGKAGQISAWISTTDILVDGLSDPPIAPLGVTAVGGTRRVQVSWSAVVRRDLKYYEIWRSPSVSGAPTGYSLLAQVGGTVFVDADSAAMLPVTTWFYKVRAITTTDVAGDFSSEVSATTTLLIVDDLADGIINAAKFAQSLKPVGLVTDLTTPGLEGDITFNETDGQLYKYTGGAWEALIDLATITGQVQNAQIASVAASKIAGQLTAAQIQSLTAAQISGQLVASQLAAGSVTTAALAVGSASNLCWNSCLPQSTDGWAFVASVGVVSGSAWPAGSWVPTGFGGGAITTTTTLATNASQFIQGLWDPANLATSGLDVGIPWSPGQMLEVQCKLMTHRCCARVQVDFYDASGAYISSATGNRVTGTPVNDLTLSSYNLSYLITSPPAGTARARGSVVGYNDGGSDIAAQTSPPFLFYTEFAIGASVPNATQPAPWVQGGVATIQGGMIKAASILSAAIAAGAIQAGNIAAGAITAGKIAALAVTAGTLAANAVTAGTIAAGAITANEIAAGTIHATMLASTFQLTSSAQIGTAIITTAQIANLTVGTSNMALSSISEVFTTTGGFGVDPSLTVNSDGSPTLIWWNAQTISSWTSDSVEILIDGVAFMTYAVPGGGTSQITIPGNFAYKFLNPGSHTIQLTSSAPGSYVTSSLAAVLVKR